MMASKYGRHYLYKADKVDMNKPSIKYGDPIMLTSGAPTIEFPEFDIEFNLFSGLVTFKGCINVKWENPRYNGVSIHEKIIKSEDGTCGICVQYGLFANAAVANVKVNLLGDSSSTYVHGFLVASNSRLDLPTRANVLFWKESADEKIQVKDGVIPFSNNRVGVPLDSEFHVVIILKCDGVDYTTKLDFVPQETGTIQGNACEDKFQVIVTWGV